MKTTRPIALLAFLGALTWAWSSNPPQLTRGPYLQDAATDHIRIVCRTSTAVPVVLRARTLPGQQWDIELTSPSGTEHDFVLTGLLPQRRYDYELEANGCLLAGGPDHTFRTPPAPASRWPFRFLAFGDSGTGDAPQADVAARMEEVTPRPELLLGLGDLVYENGEAANYDPRFFSPYAALLRRATVWATLGNHDANTNGGAPFFQAFRFPTNTGAPGHPSNSEHYYSFDHGMAHFVCLDSEGESTSASSPMRQWLIDDLDDAVARDVRWLIVFMHHPPYTKGTHDSDTESHLIRIHDDLVPVFESRGVDLVLVGHSHVYERSFLVKDDAVLQNDPGDYTKIGSPDGTLYLVNGVGGRSGSGSLNHPLMATSLGNVRGFSRIDVRWDAIHGAFVEDDGDATDLFTLRKAADVAPPHLLAAGAPAPGQVQVTFDEPVRAGTGPGGAESADRYVLTPAVQIVSAALSRDRRVVTLSTGPLPSNRTLTLQVSGVEDAAGNPCSERHALVRAVEAGQVETVAVPRTAEWNYLEGTVVAPPGWITPTFDAVRWARGQAGFGYGDGDDTTVLSGMRGSYATLYARTEFTVADPERVAAMTLRVRRDDGFVAYLNGLEIARAGVPWGQDRNTLADRATEATAFEDFDVTAFRPWLASGTNVLAVEGHNVAVGDDDFTLQAELALLEVAPHGPPVAVARADHSVANAPARILFSASGSSDRDGPLTSWSWDFGDGATAAGPEVAHVFDRPGAFDVTLSVRDAAGDQALASLPIRIHDQGRAPQAGLTVDRIQAAPGERVAFSAATSFDPDGGPLAYQWDFGEPASGSANHSGERDAVHAYAGPGRYSVTLTVVDDEGSEELSRLDIEILPGVSGPGTSGGGCSLAPGEGPRNGDPSLALALGAVLTLLVLRRRTPALAKH